MVVVVADDPVGMYICTFGSMYLYYLRTRLCCRSMLTRYVTGIYPTYLSTLSNKKKQEPVIIIGMEMAHTMVFLSICS
jgi:hypothetical protein